MKKIAVFTSGGDSPGMNACIRAVVRTALHEKLEVYGICRGYAGMIDGDFQKLSAKSVSNIIQRGGTILKSARCKEFRTEEGRKKAYDNLRKLGIEGLIAIGGDGTFRGADIFESEFGIPSIGIPGTIDNDLLGTDFCIGYDTAVNTVVQAVDKIRDTATSHDRMFFVEVMGRDAGFIAMRSGISVGAECILIPETKTYIDSLITKLEKDWIKKKDSIIVIVAEGDDEGGAYEIAKKVNEKFSYYDTRVSVLGHMQRGGSPTAADRVLASKLGYAATMALIEGKKNVMAGVENWKVIYTPFSLATKHHQEINPDLVNLAEILSEY